MSRTRIVDRTKVWERWFAWFPVYVENEVSDGWIRVWWEPVERRLKPHGYDLVWEYRLAD